MDFLAIDVGNSRIKTLYQSNKSNSHISVFHNDNDFLSYINTLSLSSISLIVCDVRNKLPNNFFEIIKNTKHHIILSHLTNLPIKNNYDTPHTLGYDRIASVVAATYIFPEANSLIIDAGTAITYDIITHNKEYLGGAISPGIQMRFRALNEFTGKLPLVKFNEIKTFPAKNTSNCIELGVINGVIAEINDFIENANQQFYPLQIILTGGDSPNLVKYIKKTIFVEENLVLIGLINILKYNVL